MSVYKYWSTHLLTGAILADNIPLTVQSMSRQISGTGQLTGSLSLRSDSGPSNTVYLEALEPRRSVLWASQDGSPIWAGIVWDWPHSSILDGTVPITASTPETLFSHREIRDNLTYTSEDVYDIFRALLDYALSKTPNGAFAGMTAASVTAGTTQTLTYAAADKTKILDAWTSLAAAADFEFTFTPALDAFGTGNGVIVAQFGAPLGRLDSGVVLQYPGNVLDYAYPRTGSTSANSLVATAPAADSGAAWESVLPHGQDTDDLNAGYPLLEDTVSYSGTAITAQAQIDAYADGQLPRRTRAQEVPSVILVPGKRPFLRELNLGDTVQFAATSLLHPARSDGSPGLQVSARITGWALTPPTGQQAEQTTIQLGAVV